MTQEDKSLLLQDLCARLPYGVKIHHGIPTLLISIKSDRDGMKIITEGSYGEHIFDIEDMKPCLRPMSSITEEEKKEAHRLFTVLYDRNDVICGIQINSFVQLGTVTEWLNAHHFDYRGLIEKGLALKALEGMYNLKDE